MGRSVYDLEGQLSVREGDLTKTLKVCCPHKLCFCVNEKALKQELKSARIQGTASPG